MYFALKNFINENISNDQLLILAGYGFIMCIYQSLHILSNLSADDFMPRDIKYVLDSESESASVESESESASVESESERANVEPLKSFKRQRQN